MIRNKELLRYNVKQFLEWLDTILDKRISKKMLITQDNYQSPLFKIYSDKDKLIETPLNSTEIEKISELLKIHIINYLMKVEKLNVESLPLNKDNKITEKWFFEYKKTIVFSPEFITFMYQYLSGLNKIVRKSQKPEFRVSNYLWEDFLLVVLNRYLYVFEEINIKNSILGSFFLSKLPEKEIELQRIAKQLMSEEKELGLFMLKRNFAWFINNKLRSIINGNEIEIINDNIVKELNNLRLLLGFLFDEFEQAGRYELFSFFVVFYQEFDVNIFDLIRMNFLEYRLRDIVRKGVLDIFIPLERLLNIKIDPLVEKNKSAKKYLLNYMEPVREDLEEKLRKLDTKNFAKDSSKYKNN